MKIDLARIFTREEPVAGLDISEGALRLVLFETEKNTGKQKISCAVEVPLEPGIIIDGNPPDKAKLASALKNLVKKISVKVRYVIASIPTDGVYAKIFSFPKTIQGQKLEDSMKLTIGFQLPVKPDAVYLDWQKILPDENNEVFLVAAPKNIIGDYIAALSGAGLSPVAIEQHALSIVRAADVSREKAILVKIPAITNTTVFIMKGGFPQFCRTLPNSFVQNENVEDEARKIKDFYESEYGPVESSFDIASLPIKSAANAEDSLKTGAWAVAVGAAERGSIPRSEDRMISLMPISTERAYEYQKAIFFSEFVANLAIGISGLFAVAFVAAWIIVNSLQVRTVSELEKLNSLPVPVDAAALEDKGRHVNDLIAAMRESYKLFPETSVAIRAIHSLFGAGITVTNFNMSSLDGTITASGVANDRSRLDTLKKNFAASEFVTGAQFSKTDLVQTANLPFLVAFTIKNPAALYENQ